MNQVTIPALRELKAEGKKFAALTAYDAAFAQVFAAEGVEVLLVGDSLGMVAQGRSSTLPVSLEEMCYHTTMVAAGVGPALVMADMPFMSYNTPEEAVANAGRLIKAGAQMVKLEGEAWLAETVGRLGRFGIPVCAHLGLLPQFVHKRGGYRVRGRGEQEAGSLLSQAEQMVDAGADMLLLECVPQTLAAEITANVPVPVIGIGAGPGCDGQVLVCYDMLGITPGKRPRFSRDFLAGAGSIGAAARAYVTAVKEGTFPAPEHCFD